MTPTPWKEVAGGSHPPVLSTWLGFMMAFLGLRLRRQITQCIDNFFELNARILQGRVRVGAILADAVIRKPRR